MLLGLPATAVQLAPCDEGPSSTRSPPHPRHPKQRQQPLEGMRDGAGWVAGDCLCLRGRRGLAQGIVEGWATRLVDDLPSHLRSTAQLLAPGSRVSCYAAFRLPHPVSESRPRLSSVVACYPTSCSPLLPVPRLAYAVLHRCVGPTHLQARQTTRQTSSSTA